MVIIIHHCRYMLNDMLISSSTHPGIVKSCCLQALRSTHLGQPAAPCVLYVCVGSSGMHSGSDLLSHYIP